MTAIVNITPDSTQVLSICSGHNFHPTRTEAKELKSCNKGTETQQSFSRMFVMAKD